VSVKSKDRLQLELLLQKFGHGVKEAEALFNDICKPGIERHDYIQRALGRAMKVLADVLASTEEGAEPPSEDEYESWRDSCVFCLGLSVVATIHFQQFLSALKRQEERAS
jgi:hypothetical protein